MTIDALLDDFALLDDWEERYRYVIELGRGLEPLSEAEHTPENKVRGCASQVWLVAETRDNPAGGEPLLHFRGDSDAHIVSGLIAILLAIFSDKPADDILALDERAIFHKIGLDEHLSPQRSNGLYAMAARIKEHARLAADASSN